MWRLENVKTCLIHFLRKWGTQRKTCPELPRTHGPLYKEFLARKKELQSDWFKVKAISSCVICWNKNDNEMSSLYYYLPLKGYDISCTFNPATTQYCCKVLAARGQNTLVSFQSSSSDLHCHVRIDFFKKHSK